MRALAKEWERKYKSIKAVRLIVQFGFLYVLNLGLGPYPYPLPILGSSAPWTTFPSAFDALQVLIASGTPPLLPLASIIVSNILIGRVFCGWLCPFGLAQDLTALIGRAKRRIDPGTHKSLHVVKWLVLVATLIAPLVICYVRLTGSIRPLEAYLPQGLTISPYTLISPDSTLFSFVPIAILMGMIPSSTGDILAAIFNPIIITRYLIFVLVLIAMAKIERFWCRYICPLGLMNSVVSKFSVLGFYKIASRCDNCGVCNRVCPVQIDIAGAKGGRLDMFECIGCFQCYFACERKAIVLSYKL